MAIRYVKPTSTQNNNGFNNGSSAHLYVDDDPASPDDATTEIGWSYGGPTPADVRFGFTAIDTSDMKTVEKVVGYYRAKNYYAPAPPYAASMALWMGGSYRAGTPYNVPSDGAFYTFDGTSQWLLNPETGLAWTPAALADIDGFAIYLPSGGYLSFTLAGLYVYYTPASEGTGPVRGVGSRRLRLLSSASHPSYKLSGPLRLANLQPLSPVQFSHRLAAGHKGSGFGRRPWERGLLLPYGGSIDLNTMRVEGLALLDTRRYATTLWETGRTESDGQAQEAGTARLGAGGRAYDRSSSMWIESARALSQGLIRVIALISGIEPIGYRGTLAEEERKNWLPRSSFVSGTTGLSTAGTGTNGSLLVTDTESLLFDSEVSAYSLLMQAGDPHTADLSYSHPDTGSFSANASLILSIDHVDDDGETLLCILRRLYDGHEWDPTLSAWVGWRDTTLCSAAGTTLTKTGGDGWTSAGGRMTGEITSGDGYVEFIRPGDYVVVGLSADYADNSKNSIDFAVNTRTIGVGYRVIENGSETDLAELAAADDVLRVAVESGSVVLRLNGSIIHTFAGAISYPLFARASIYYSGGTVTTTLSSSAGTTYPRIAITNRSALDGDQRDVIGPIDSGSDASAFSVGFILESGGTASRKHRLYHVQLEDGDCATSRIVTDSSAVTRAAGSTIRENFVDARVWDATRGTGGRIVIPEWDSDGLPAGAIRTIIERYDDADNWARVAYEKDEGGVVFRWCADGTEYAAIKTATFVRGTEYAIGYRWISTEGELDLEAYSLDVFVDGVKGTTVVADAMVEDDASHVYLGHDHDTANHFNGWWSYLDHSPFCLTDEEMVDFP
jgi:hypothetical protein